MKKYEEPVLNKVSVIVTNIIAVSPVDTLQDYLERNDMATEEPENIRSFQFDDEWQ